MGRFEYNGKPIVITVHAIKRARERSIAFPDQVYATINHGKIQRFGRHGIKFSLKTKQGSIVCVGEDTGQAIIIKTVERGN